MPAFRAEESPPFLLVMIWMRLSFAWAASRISKDLSVDPSFTQTISISSYVCVIAEAKDSARYSSTLYTGITIEIFAISIPTYALIC